MKKFFTFAACLIVTAFLQSQTTIFVKPDGTGDGTSWANACNLENAMQQVASAPLSDRSAGTQIWVQSGTYYPSKMLVIPDSVKIYGGFTGTETALSQRNFSANHTVVDGQQKIGSIFRLENFAEINGFTIQNGNANGNLHKNGGGIWADENTIIENCKIINNTASLNGGGVYANGKVEIINSTVEYNIAHGNGINTFGNCIAIAQTIIFSDTVAGCNSNTLHLGAVSFKTSKTWKISANGINQDWSDVVMAEACNKTTYKGGTSGDYNADCRMSSNRTTYGDLFSWCAIVRFAYVLCPAPWRVPAIDDFGNLDKALGGNGDGSGPGTVYPSQWGQYYHNPTVLSAAINSWGCLYGGSCDDSGILPSSAPSGFFWALSEYDTNRGHYSVFQNNGPIRPTGYIEKNRGLSLRCVK